MLHRLRLPAFDLCKVLDPFVLQLPTLPRCVQALLGMLMLAAGTAALWQHMSLKSASLHRRWKKSDGVAAT